MIAPASVLRISDTACIVRFSYIRLQDGEKLPIPLSQGDEVAFQELESGEVVVTINDNALWDACRGPELRKILPRRARTA